MNKNFNDEQALCMAAFLFESDKIEDSFYGERVFESIIKGSELLDNNNKVVVSTGDIFHREIYDDITPFLIKDELCTIERNIPKYRTNIFAVLLEDISVKNALALDRRIKKECPAYLGMTSVDVDSTDERKQFWKMLVREFSIEGKTLTCFGYEESGFAYLYKAKEYGFRVNYDSFPDEHDCENQVRLFSTRQSSFITKVEQLELKRGRNDSDRGISEMNFSLVKEVEIAGVQIWKAIEDINQVFIPKSGNWVVIDYLFTSLYQAAQGIERLFKILIELMVYDNNSCDRIKADKLLLSHNHVGMYEFLSKYQILSVGKNERKFLQLISKFYNEGRYNRFKYSENSALELKLLQEFGNDIQEEEFDDKIKHRYGKVMGKISRKLYGAILRMSRKLNIFVYELQNDSVARFVLNTYYRDDLYELLKEMENSKRELLWYLFKKGKDMEITKAGRNIEALPFDEMELQMYIEELVCNRNSGGFLYEFVSDEYDEQIAEDKEKWKNRLGFMKTIGNPNVYWEYEEYEEYEEE